VDCVLYDVVTVGSATVDVFAKTESELVKFVSSDGEKDFIAYPSGSKLLISDLQFLIGGGGTNTAVAFSRLGFKTGYIGKIGNDENGQKVLDILNKENIDFLGKQEGQTGYSIILDSIEEDRSILTYKGANNELKKDDVDISSLQGKWLYSSSMVEESFETLKYIFEKAKQNGMKVAFNPSNYQAKLGFEALKDVLSNVDVLILNLEEAKLLVGNEHLHEQEIAPKLIQHADDIIIITDGPRGATAYSKKQFYHITPSPHLKVIETTGAGDAFSSGFIAGLLRRYTIEDALKLGMVEAESAITNKGAKNGLLQKEESFRHLGSFKGVVKSYTPSNQTNTVLPRAEPHHSFKLNDGTVIHSLQELDHAIKVMSDDTFRHHVYEGTNHFSNWILDVFGLSELSERVKLSTTKIALRVVLNDYAQKLRKS